MKDTLAYLIDVGSRPIPYIFAGLVAGWLITSLDKFDDDTTALLMTLLLAVGVSLFALPPFLRVHRWAKEYLARPSTPEDSASKFNYANEILNWGISMSIGTVLLALWLVLWVRLS